MAQKDCECEFAGCRTPLGVEDTESCTINVNVDIDVMDNQDEDSVIIILSIPGNIPSAQMPSAQPPPLQLPQRPVIRIPRLCEADLVRMNAYPIEAENGDYDDTDSEYDSNSSGEEYVPNEEEEILSGDE